MSTSPTARCTITPHATGLPRSSITGSAEIKWPIEALDYRTALFVSRKTTQIEGKGGRREAEQQRNRGALKNRIERDQQDGLEAPSASLKQWLAQSFVL